MKLNDTEISREAFNDYVDTCSLAGIYVYLLGAKSITRNTRRIIEFYREKLSAEYSNENKEKSEKGEP